MNPNGGIGKVNSSWVNATPFIPRVLARRSPPLPAPEPPRIKEPENGSLVKDGPDLYVDWEEYACARVCQANATSQISFIKRLLPQLNPQSLLYIQKEITDLIRVDFLSTLSDDIVTKLLDYIDVLSLCRCALVCRSWNEIIGPAWVVACQRRGIDINSADATRERCIGRLQRLDWRLSKLEAGQWHDLICAYPQASLPADDSTVSFVALNKYNLNSGHISAMVSPGMVVFYPLPDSGGVTYFLRTGIVDKPACMHTAQNVLFIAYSWGLIQMWDWRNNALVCGIDSGEDVTCLEYIAQFDLLAVGTAQGAVILWKPLQMQLVQCFPPTFSSLGVSNIKYLSCNCGGDGESTSEDSGTWSPTFNNSSYRLFIAFTLQFPTDQIHPSTIGSRKRIWCSLVVWEIEPSTGHAIHNIYNVTPEKRGLKSTLQVNRTSNTLLYVSENYEFSSYLSPDARLHELNPISGVELSTALDCYTVNGDGECGMEWQVLGVGTQFAALGLWQLQLMEGGLLSPTSSFVICARTNDDDDDAELSRVPMGGQTWKQVMSLSQSDMAPSSGTGLFSTFELTNQMWLDGFDGTNDMGHLMAACYWDYVQGGWRIKSFKWTEKEQKQNMVDNKPTNG